MIYGIKEAAHYLGLSVSSVKYHLYCSRDLLPDQVIGNRVLFTQKTLDTFSANKRQPGRPVQHEVHHEN